MTSPEPDISCARAQALLEPHLDGELAPGRRTVLEAHLRRCAGCREELAAAQVLRSGLRALPKWRCPEVVLHNVLAQVGAEAGTAGLASRLASGILARVAAAVWRPALAAASIAALALGIGILARTPRIGAPAEDLVRAEREARWALAYVAELTGRSAMQSVVGEVVAGVIGKQVIAPLTDAVQRPLLEEEKI